MVPSRIGLGEWVEFLKKSPSQVAILVKLSLWARMNVFTTLDSCLQYPAVDSGGCAHRRQLHPILTFHFLLYLKDTIINLLHIVLFVIVYAICFTISP